MAKKNEFKPDRLYSSWVSRLMPTRKQRKSMLKWTVYALLMLLLSALQDVLFSRVDVWGVTTELVPCGIILICLLEGSESGSVFALVGSSLFYFSGSAPGSYSIVLLTLSAIVVTIFRQAMLQSGLGAAIVCTALGLLLYECSTFLAAVMVDLTYWSRIIDFLKRAAVTLPAIPILYPISLAVGRIGGSTWNE